MSSITVTGEIHREDNRHGFGAERPGIQVTVFVPKAALPLCSTMPRVLAYVEAEINRLETQFRST